MDPLAAQTSFLVSWFSRYGSDPAYELEARIKDVSQAAFEEIRRRLETNKFWHSKSTTRTVDANHRSGTRETRGDDGRAAPSYLRKQRVVTTDVWVPGSSSGTHDQLVRFSVSTETRADAPPQHSSDDVEVVRVKTRHSFNHKNEFLFELTEVRSGWPDESAARRSSTQYEVELEWCGWQVAHRYSPEHLAEKLVSKVRDLLGMKMSAEVPQIARGQSR